MNISRSLAMFSASLLLWGCSDMSSGTYSGSGYLSVVAHVDPTVTVFSTDTPAEISENIPEPTQLSLRITDIKGVYTHTWESLADYDEATPLAPGSYVIETFYGDALSESFDQPYFYSSSTVEIASSQILHESMECVTANAMLRMYYDKSFTDAYPGSYVTLHSEGGNYIRYPADETRPLFMKPGNISVTVNLTQNGNDTIRFQIYKIQRAQPRYYYKLTVSASMTDDGIEQIIVSFDEGTEDDDIVVMLTDKFLTEPGPEMAETGFTSSSKVEAKEGVRFSEPLISTVKVTDKPLQKLVLSTNAPNLLADGWPQEIDLLQANDSELMTLSSMGLRWSDLSRMATEGGSVDFTEVIPNLRVTSESDDFMFALRAIDTDSKVSLPSILNVEIKPVAINLLEVSDAIVGINETTVTISAPEGIIEEDFEIQTRSGTGNWETTRILQLNRMDDGNYSIRCEIPDGTSDIGIRIFFCGTLRGEQKVNRISPEYSIEADPFAYKAVLRINAEDEALIPVITSHLSVFDGSTRLSVSERNPESGLVVITGLIPAKRYNLNATVMNSAQQTRFNIPVSFTTESIRTLPNGDFEEFESEIKYKDMASGGRYSQSYMMIFNRQNRTSFDITVPELWANTNAKTFCMSAVNHNTWYLQPSVYTTRESVSGSYGVILTSVAWDLSGEEIADYAQLSEPFTPYSCNVPEISYRAAAKVFLGKYRFNPKTLEETYNEGINFNSRPASLNGYYSYVPGKDMLSDCGYARIEVIGKVDGNDEVIAAGTKRLEPASGQTAFSIPLTYDRFGVKATELRVFFSSSCEFGDIAYETRSIITTPDVTTSTSTGSQLWLDGINLSY